MAKATPKAGDFGCSTHKMKNKKIIAIIGILSSIIGIITFFTGRSSIQDFFKRKDSYSIKTISKNTYFSPNNEAASKSDFSTYIHYDITYPAIKYPDNTFVENKINELIKTTYTEWDISLDDIKKSGWLGEVQGNYKIAYKIENLLGLRIKVYWYGSGAAHGNVSIITHNINLKNGEIFEFKDLFRSSGKYNINNLIVQKLKKHECFKRVPSPKEINVRDDQEFYLEKDKLVIVFPKYEIACGACGPVEAIVRVSEIKNFINPNGPLGFLI